MSFGKMGAMGRGFGRLGSAGKSGAVLHLSNALISDAASIGDLIGTLSVIGGTGVYTYSFVSNPGTKYAIDGDAVEAAAPLTAGSDAITIEANNGAGSVVRGSFLITVTSSSGNALKFDYSNSTANQTWMIL